MQNRIQVFSFVWRLTRPVYNLEDWAFPRRKHPSPNHGITSSVFHIWAYMFGIMSTSLLLAWPSCSSCQLVVCIFCWSLCTFVREVFCKQQIVIPSLLPFQGCSCLHFGLVCVSCKKHMHFISVRLQETSCICGHRFFTLGRFACFWIYANMLLFW